MKIIEGEQEKKFVSVSLVMESIGDVEDFNKLLCGYLKSIDPEGSRFYHYQNELKQILDKYK